MPSRMTFNDARKQAWYSDLANPDVPLHKLGRNIPHGVRGHELLEMLQSINVSVQRAVWFIRVFGSNETVDLFLLTLSLQLTARLLIGWSPEQTKLQSYAIQC